MAESQDNSTDEHAGEPRASIAPQPNGPLKVTDLTTFHNSRGDAIETKPAMFLCRCGGSSNKPFCDGTHKRIGFSDAKADDRVPDALDRYAGRDITILDNRGVCAHAGHCTSGLPAVWRMDVEPWIDADGAPREHAVRTIRQCPSGALSFLEDGRAQTEYHARAGIQVSSDGPYHVRGGVALEGVDFGEGASREHYTLCRCGRSRNKPFCDGSHWHVGFHDDEAITIAAAEQAGSPKK